MSKAPISPNEEILEYIKEAFAIDGDTVYRRWKMYSGSLNGDGYKHFQLGKYYGNLTISAHHISWFLYYGSWPEEQLDHKDRNRLNNNPENLRYSDNYSNAKNRINAQGTLPPGVKLKKNGYYEAYIGFEGKKIYCGMGFTAWEAFEKYKEKYLELYGEALDESNIPGDGGS